MIGEDKWNVKLIVLKVSCVTGLLRMPMIVPSVQHRKWTCTNYSSTKAGHLPGYLKLYHVSFSFRDEHIWIVKARQCKCMSHYKKLKKENWLKDTFAVAPSAAYCIGLAFVINKKQSETQPTGISDLCVEQLGKIIGLMLLLSGNKKITFLF